MTAGLLHIFRRNHPARDTLSGGILLSAILSIIVIVLSHNRILIDAMLDATDQAIQPGQRAPQQFYGWLIERCQTIQHIAQDILHSMSNMCQAWKIHHRSRATDSMSAAIRLL